MVCPCIRYIYGSIGVFGRAVTRVFFASSHRPNFFNTSTRSKRLRTLRFLAPLNAFPKLECLDMCRNLLFQLLNFWYKCLASDIAGKCIALLFKSMGKIIFQRTRFRRRRTVFTRGLISSF